MLLSILEHTPVWVWALFAALWWLGLSQTREREMSLARITRVPLVMIGLSLAGVAGAFGHEVAALGGWAAGVAAALALGGPLVAPRGAAWLPQRGTLRVPGSWLPLVLIVGLFLVKYAAGVSLAMHPGLATDARFAGSVSLAYGGFSGLLLARGLRLRGLARPAGVSAAAPLVV